METSALSLVTDIAPEDQQKLITNVTDLCGQADRAIINSDETAGHGADLEKVFNDRLKAIEAKRVELTGPLNETLRKINAGFKNLSDPLKAGKAVIHGKNAGWAREQARIAQEIADKKAEEIRVAAEEEARIAREASENRRREEQRIADELAEKQKKAAAAAKRKGDEKEAKRIREQAKQDKIDQEQRDREAQERQEATDKAIKEEGEQAAATTVATASAGASRGGLGSSASARKTWKCEVVDVTKVEERYLEVNTKLFLSDLMLKQDEFKLEGKREGKKGVALEGYVAPKLKAWADEQKGVKLYQDVGVMIR